MKFKVPRAVLTSFEAPAMRGVQETGKFLKKGLMKPESQKAAREMSKWALETKKSGAEISKTVDDIVKEWVKSGRTGFKPGSPQSRLFDKLLELQKKGMK